MSLERENGDIDQALRNELNGIVKLRFSYLLLDESTCTKLNSYTNGKLCLRFRYETKIKSGFYIILTPNIYKLIYILRTIVFELLMIEEIVQNVVVCLRLI